MCDWRLFCICRRLGHRILFEYDDEIALELFEVGLLALSQRLDMLHYLCLNHIVSVLVEGFQGGLIDRNDVSSLENVTVMFCIVAP